MTLHPTMKRRLHDRLRPLIGEEEADALLEEISPPDPVTREWLQDRFDQMDRRFEQVDRRFDLIDQRFEQVDQRFEQVATKEWVEDRFVSNQYLDARLEVTEQRIRATLEERLKQHTYFLVAVATFIGVVSGVVQSIIGA